MDLLPNRQDWIGWRPRMDGNSSGTLRHGGRLYCPSCRFDNEATHKFCAECGSKLTNSCTSCGHNAEPGHRFCPECGSALGPQESADEVNEASIVAERRLVTSLFCDLVGFTAFSATRDPEQVRAMLTQYFDRSRDVVERFGGVIDKFTGDAITVFWGATRAEQDDAERAVRAALELVESVANLGEEIGVPELRLRAGVLTGETAVGPGGNQTGLVLGDVVNVAARLQSIADPGTVAVGDSTKELTEDSIAYEEIGLRDLKGKEAPVRVWRAVRVATALGGRGRRDALEPPFVGRDYELRVIKDLLHVTGSEQRARMVSIVGDPGIGKSRLAWEFQKYVDGLVEDIYWHQGRSPAYGDGLTFWSLGEMIRRRTGLGELEDPQKSRMRLRTAVAEYLQDSEDQRWIEPRLAGLLGLEEMPAGDRTELYAAIRTFFQRISERGTTVLVFEDLHWADTGLLEFIEELIDRSPHHPILVVSLARPDLLDRAEGWGGGRRNLTSIHLGPIADGSMRDLVEGTVPGLERHLLSAIVERAAGVPLYAVEMIRTLVNDGTVVAAGDGTYRVEGDITRITVPDSLQAVIGARIDRLEPELRALLKNAAVLGQSFTIEGLGVVAGTGSDDIEPLLARLVETEILRLEDDPRSPERGQYQFIQGLIREVAYGRLTLGERKKRHLAVADYFEQIEDVEVAGVVASHLIDAHRADPKAADAAELASRGLEALIRSAHRAADLHSHRQVLALSDRARAMAVDEKVKGELQLLRAKAAGGLADREQALAASRSAASIFADIPDEDGRLRAMTLVGTALIDGNRPFDAIDELQPVFADHDPPATSPELELAAALSRAHMMANQPIDSIEVAESALPAAEGLEDLPVLVDLLITKGTSLIEVGRRHESLAVIRGALALAEAHDLTLAALRAHNNIGVVLGLEDHKATDENGRAAWEKALALGDPSWIYRYAFDRAAILQENGRLSEVRAIEAQLDPAVMPEITRRQFEYLWAFVEVTNGDAPAGLEKVRANLDILGDAQEPQIKAIAGWLNAEVSVMAGDFAEGFDRAMAVEHVYGYPSELEWALIAAIWLDDPDQVAAASERISMIRERGRLISALQTFAAAATARASGGDDATDLARHLLDETHKIRHESMVGVINATVARLLGPENPLGAEAAQTAHRIFVDHGRVNLLEVFAEGLPVIVPAEAATG